MDQFWPKLFVWTSCDVGEMYGQGLTQVRLKCVTYCRQSKEWNPDECEGRSQKTPVPRDGKLISITDGSQGDLSAKNTFFYFWIIKHNKKKNNPLSLTSGGHEFCVCFSPVPTRGRQHTSQIVHYLLFLPDKPGNWPEWDTGSQCTRLWWVPVGERQQWETQRERGRKRKTETKSDTDRCPTLLWA